MAKPTTASQMCGQRMALQPVAVGLANHTFLLAKDDMERLIDYSGAPIRAPTGRSWMLDSSFTMSPSPNGLRKSGRVWPPLWSPRGHHHRPYFGRDQNELELGRLATQARQDGAHRCSSARGLPPRVPCERAMPRRRAPGLRAGRRG